MGDSTDLMKILGEKPISINLPCEVYLSNLVSCLSEPNRVKLIKETAESQQLYWGEEYRKSKFMYDKRKSLIDKQCADEAREKSELYHQVHYLIERIEQVGKK